MDMDSQMPIEYNFIPNFPEKQEENLLFAGKVGRECSLRAAAYKRFAKKAGSL